jgi:transcriptional regulator with XRE-family HTH domain
MHLEAFSLVFKTKNDRLTTSMATPLQKNLRDRLTEKGISVHALEKRSGVKPSSIQNILQGKSKKPSADLLLAIAHELGCTVENLLQTDLSSPPETALLHKIDASRPIFSLKKEAWVPHLYVEALKKIQALLENKKLTPSKEVFLSLVEEVYTYSLKGNPPSVDERFAEWLISKQFIKETQ